MKKPLIQSDQRRRLAKIDALIQYYILGDDGQPRKASFLRWSIWAQAGKNTIAVTYLFDEAVRISTVFLPFDHNSMKSLLRRIAGQSDVFKPHLFETMIFGNSELRDESRRYSTLEDALLGHMQITELAKSVGLGFGERE